MESMQVNRSIILFSVALLAGFIFSCTKELDGNEYKAFVSNPENGLRKNQTIGDFELSAMYEPANYLLAQGNGDISKEEYEQYEHFQFRIKLNPGGNILLYKEKATRRHNPITIDFLFLHTDEIHDAGVPIVFCHEAFEWSLKGYMTLKLVNVSLNKCTLTLK